MLKKTSKGYEDISVELIDYNKDIAEHCWNCYRMTWNNLQNINYNTENEEVIKGVTNIIKFRALPVPREQAIMTFRINNISRICLAQITRQRKACFNVESQMPCPVNHNVIIPLNFIDDPELNKEANDLANYSQALYDKAIAKGIPPQDARYLLLHGQTTSCVYIVNVNDFVSSFGFRCENNLSDEINLVYRLCKQAILDKIEADYKNDKIDKLTYKFYYDIITPADAAGAKQEKGMNYDEVFGNSFKRFPDGNNEITQITKNCSYDFKKSAWYRELIKMFLDPVKSKLLFKGEPTMIKEWLLKEHKQ